MNQPEDRVFGTGRKVYRRRKRFQGATWTPPSMSADVTDGLWCRPCNKRHGYMVLGLKYEKDSKDRWVMIWYCKKYGHVLSDKTLQPKVEEVDDDSSS